MTQTITTKSGKTIDLRSPRESDIDQLMTYINKLVDEDTYILINQRQSKEDEQKYVKNTIQKIKDGKRTQLLAFYQKELVGNCQIDKGLYREAHVGEFGISVKNNFRGEGLGGQLAQATIKLARKQLDLTRIKLEVFSENQPAISLYQKLGFKGAGTLPGFVKYQDRFIDKTIMYLKL